MEFETKRQFYQNFSAFEDLNENFEFRRKMCAFVSAIQIVAYPKYMFVNRNMVAMQCYGGKRKD